MADIDSGISISGLHGMGGIGKTALMLQLAYQLIDRFPDGQIYLDLKGVDVNYLRPVDSMAHIIRTYQPDIKLPDDPNALAGLYQSVLHGKQTLLLLDNIRDAAQVIPLLPSKSCLLLVTSRVRFTLPGMRAHAVDELPLADSVALLLGICERIGQLAAPIAEQCGRLPLALRLAGSVLMDRPDLEPVEYLRRLRETHNRLNVLDRGAPDGLGLTASLRLSESLLPAAIQPLFRRLAVFISRFDLAAAAAVWKLTPEDGDEAMGALLRTSLVDWDASEQTYRLHDLVHAYANARLEEPERTDSLRCHAQHFLTVTSQAEKLYQQGGEDFFRGLNCFDKSWQNIEAAFRWAEANAGHDTVATELCRELPLTAVHCLWLRQPVRVHQEWFASALSAARQSGDKPAEARALGYLGLAYRDLDDTKAAIDCLEQELVLARELGNRSDEANALGNLGTVYVNLGEIQRGINCYQEVLAIANDLKDAKIKANALGGLGIAYTSLSKPRDALPIHQEQLVITREIGDRAGEADALANLGSVYLNLGESRLAISMLEQQLTIVREIGDKQREANSLGSIASEYINLGLPQQAFPLLEQQVNIARELSNQQLEAYALGNMGVAYHLSGETARSIEFLQRFLRLSEVMGSHHWICEGLNNLGEAYLTLGDPAKALDYFNQALTIAKKNDYQQSEGYILGNQGLALAELGQLPRAIELCQQHVKIAQAIGDRRGLALANWNLGKSFAKTGDLARAREHMQQRIDYEREMGCALAEQHAAELVSIVGKDVNL
jgi:tetratricopeptide (TPR) repeat protein